MSITSPLFSGYSSTSGAYDETFQPDGQPRAQYRALVDRLLGLSAEELAYRQRASDFSFMNQGITFTVYGDKQGTERTFPFDLLPRILTAGEWDNIERGLTQRLTALNRFLHDIYHDGHIFKDGVVPYAMLASSKHWSTPSFLE